MLKKNGDDIRMKPVALKEETFDDDARRSQSDEIRTIDSFLELINPLQMIRHEVFVENTMHLW